MPLSWQAYDRILGVGLCIFFIAAAKGVSYGLHEIVRLTEIRNPPPPTAPEPRAISPDAASRREAADSIPIQSLLTLAKSTNHDLSHSAQCLILDRFMRDKACLSALCRALISRSPEERRRAGKIQTFIEEQLGLNSIFEQYPAISHSFLERTLWPGSSAPHRDWNAMDIEDGEPWYELPPAARRRDLEETVEEIALRRRRREAMVFNEGDHPVSRADIIQRQPSMENVGSPQPRLGISIMDGLQSEPLNGSEALSNDSTSTGITSSDDDSSDDDQDAEDEHARLRRSTQSRQSAWGP